MITLPGPLAAADMPSYLAQVVRELNMEIASSLDASAKIENLMTSVEQLRGRLDKLEAQLKAPAKKE